MPFRYNPSHWRERAAQMRALAVDTTDAKAAAIMAPAGEQSPQKRPRRQAAGRPLFFFDISHPPA